MKKAVVISILAIASIGCGPNESILKSSRNTSRMSPTETLEPRKSTFENELADMVDGGFDYIFVIRRKDGAAFADEDKKFLREAMPPEINRRVLADDGKALIVGSGFALDVKTIELWRKRFVVEDRPQKTEEVESQR